jgi:hypothetical protein
MSDDEFSAAVMRNIVRAKSTDSHAKLITDEWEEIKQKIKARADKGERSASFGSHRLWKVNADKLVARGFTLRKNTDNGDLVIW